MTAAAIAATCGLDECASDCHRPAAGGRYCAPARCYCYGCPGSLGPVDRGRPLTAEQIEQRRQQLVADARRQIAGAAFAVDVSRRLGTFAGVLVAA